jgi:hypothetical protein
MYIFTRKKKVSSSFPGMNEVINIRLKRKSDKMIVSPKRKDYK